MRDWLVINDLSAVLRVRVATMTREGGPRVRFFRDDGEQSFWIRDPVRKGRTVVNIDGAVILDLDEDGRLIGVDSLISSDLWRRGTFDVPTVTCRGELFLDEARGRDVYVDEDVPVEVLIGPAGILKLSLKGAENCESRVDLSDDCAALVAQERLVGFLIAKDPGVG